MEEFSEIAQHLLRSSPDALIVVDVQGRIRFANDTVAELLGYAPTELIGQSMDMLVPERLRPRHGDHVAAFFNAPRSREMGARIADLTARRADGTEFPADIRLAPFNIGATKYVAAAVRDRTERQRAAEVIIAAREEADRANRAKSRFLATASHDLRQPLQTVRLLNAAMLRMTRDQEIVGLLQRQEQAIDGMTRLLNALLDISRLESGAIEPQRTPVRLSEVLSDLRTQFETIARTRGLGLYVSGEDVAIMTDRILLGQLLENLLGNAVKYTDRGSIAVRCSLLQDVLAIDIEDTGIGIPAEKIEHIFDEYYQVDSSGTRRAGVGLGLAIVREVARLLGYTISVKSRIGNGTQVRIEIPRQTLVSAAPAASTAGSDTTAHAPRGRGRVILVEDNEGVRMATELFLKLEGYETRSAASAAEAEKLFAQLRGDEVLVADYHLDAQNTGLDLVSRVRQIAGRDVPAIILSGDLPAVMRTVRSPVANCRFLGKPVDTNALLDAIAELSSSVAAA